MKSFFKYVLATVTGIILSVVLLFVVGLIIIGGIINSISADKDVVVPDNALLIIDLKYELTERTIPDPFDGIDVPGFVFTKNLGLDDILKRIKAAKDDDHIKGIYLDLSVISANFASLQEIRDALLDFKESGKFVVAYSELYTQRAYYLASTADRVYVNPEGTLDFRGLASQTMFLKGTFDKLGIETQVVKVGTYKSAVEPYTLGKMSDANREQVASFIGSIYDHFISEIAASRKLNPDSLRAIADQYAVRNADDAVNHGLADGKKYKDEILSELKGLLEISQDKDISAITLTKYKPKTQLAGSSMRDRIAVVYAVGEIVGGEGGDEIIGSERISRELRRVRRDDKVKAVVFRVNSPGGSALASDVIWREVELLKQEKPIIVSMGDVAASGGYYIAAAADSIFAQPNTITGSIGVFGLIPNLQGLYNDKLGITYDGVKTSKYADMLTTFDRPLTADERNILQLEVERIYDTFLQRVADGRGLSKAQVDSIGQGRVWSGQQALAIGLVDRLGSIEDAIAAAASKAGLGDYRIVTYPAIKNPFESLLVNTTDRVGTWFGKRELGEQYRYYEQVKEAIQLRGIQARLPFELEIY
ncbi:signal peptide peptidase SppA [Parapedobacter koreensis]|uniref:Signal peptide peptidase A. Serine peptidase. MEROPS family S49 n=1 Tax=Parapedobacter koreensis TaxID=332977 RepID=A0A1H7RCJ6_9SPHI|nr:signal peptide peptidase SppA [Parapedobacter koreensis]SEL58016.1 signal peptide peptidase A. Serine peptidase. MEROPS family S49 [Parapedobacter koreensis]